MALALSPNLPPGILSHLIVADIAPSKGALSSEFRNYTDAMHKIEQLEVTTRKEANDIIHEIEPVGHGNPPGQFTSGIADAGTDTSRIRLFVLSYSQISRLLMGVPP